MYFFTPLNSQDLRACNYSIHICRNRDVSTSDCVKSNNPLSVQMFETFYQNRIINSSTNQLFTFPVLANLVLVGYLVS